MLIKFKNYFGPSDPEASAILSFLGVKYTILTPLPSPDMQAI